MRRPQIANLEYTLSFDFPVILDLSKPSVTLHKNGRILLFKPNDVIAADILRELELRMAAQIMREGAYYGADGTSVSDFRKVELWKHLAGDITKHPFCALLKSYGVEIGTSPTLENYIRKEYSRRVLEATPYTAIPVSNDDVSLFERCSPGANLLCIKSFVKPGDTEPTFEKKKRYMVARTGGEGVDQVGICTEPIKHGAKIELVGEGLIFSWSAMDKPMELYFDDSENIDFGKTVPELYPDRIATQAAKMAKLPFVIAKTIKDGKHPLYEHVRLDALEESLKRGVVNCKLMRMGKTSEAITIVELWGSKHVAVVGSKNVRLAWRKEFKRLGMTDYVMVNRLADLKKEGKYFLLTFDWIKDNWDPSAKQRYNNENYLRASERKVRRKVEYQTKPDDIIVYQYNACPHCKAAMQRYDLLRDPSGKITEVRWTTKNGYMCRNPKCTWDTDNRSQATPLGNKVIKGGASHRGAAWAETGNKLVHHKAGTYVDYGLAAHAKCSGEHITGRICNECGQTDGTWIPPRYRRFKDQFTAVVGDEIHNAKDYTSQNAKAMYSFRARRKMAMTGTLLSNSPLDAYWPLYWAIGGPQKQFPYFHLEGKTEFKDRFCDFVYLEKPTGEVDEETGEEITKTVKKQTPFLINPPDWWRMMQPKIKRRNYSDPLFLSSLIEAGMKQPKVSINTVNCVMHPKQVSLMLDALRDFKKQYAQMVSDAAKKNQEVNKALVIAKMTTLRKIATVPERLNSEFGFEVYPGVPYSRTMPVNTAPFGGGKMAIIKQLVDTAVAKGQKVLILSDFQLMQRNCEEALTQYNPIRLLTSWGDERRDEAVTTFADDASRMVFIAGTRAVRESIDLSAADVTICCDLLWSPAFQCQAWSRTMAATARARDCEVYLMVSKNSLDEHIYTVFYSKMVGAEQALDRKVMNRRAMDFDVKFFAERVLEEEEALSLQLRDTVGDDKVEAFVPEMDLSLLEERL